MKKLIYALILLPSALFADYEFSGKHYIAEYRGCKSYKIYDTWGIRHAIMEGCKKSGATLLKGEDYVFVGGGYTCVVLLAESHASVHTYPEIGACFIDIFTCGDATDISKFVYELERFFEPERIEDDLIERGDSSRKGPPIVLESEQIPKLSV